MYRPPSIQTLRALDAAARLRSFSRAAAELGVTHGAISHRIREIEERLGEPLFERRGNSMEPTAAARRVLPAVRKALDLITSVFPPPLAAGPQVIRVGVLPSFAANWLVPRLDDFHTLHPHVAVELDARLEVSPIGPGGLDAAIRYGSGGWPGLLVERLVSETLFPACSPAYRDQHGIRGAQDFGRGRLLRNSWHGWTPWFQRAGLDLAEPSEGMTYNDAGLMLDAAIAGHGIALVRRVIAHDAIAHEQLVRLSPIEIPYEGAYHYVRVPMSGLAASATDAFGMWLAGRMARDFPQGSTDSSQSWPRPPL